MTSILFKGPNFETNQPVPTLSVSPVNLQQSNPIDNQSQQQQSIKQQPLVSFYNSNTSGFFINTDSVYGNQILPVLPRF